jgi:hypothetical protein
MESYQHSSTRATEQLEATGELEASLVENLLYSPRIWRGNRYSPKTAQGELVKRIRDNDPHTCPYADEFYWAGFQIMGW